MRYFLEQRLYVSLALVIMAMLAWMLSPMLSLILLGAAIHFAPERTS